MLPKAIEQLELLQAEGCTEGQGYFFSRPRSAGDLPGLMRSHRQAAIKHSYSEPSLELHGL